MSNEADDGRFVGELSALLSLQAEVNSLIVSRCKLTSAEEASLRDKVKEWLKKARDIAKEFRPRDYTIGLEVGFPPRASVAFTWETPRES